MDCNKMIILNLYEQQLNIIAKAQRFQKECHCRLYNIDDENVTGLQPRNLYRNIHNIDDLKSHVAVLKEEQQNKKVIKIGC